MTAPNRRLRRLPSLAVILAAAGFVATLSVVPTSVAQWQSSSDQYEAASDVAADARRFSNLIRVSASLTRESLSMGFMVAADDFLDPKVRGFLGLEQQRLEARSQIDRAGVDLALAELGDDEITQKVLGLRTSLEEPDADFVAVAGGYYDLRQQLISEIDDLSSSLVRSASVARHPEVADTVRLARELADAQLTASTLSGVVAELLLPDIVDPAAVDVIKFQTAWAVFSTSFVDRQQDWARQGGVGPEVAELIASDIGEQAIAIYRETSDELMARGLSTRSEGLTIVIDGVPLQELVGSVSRLNLKVTTVDGFDLALESLVHEALDEVVVEADTTLTDARSSLIFASLAGFGTFAAFGFTGLSLVILVARPTRRLAGAAAALSRGDLDVELPERGPKEIRVAAQALNEAIVSVRLAEAQATALAEERLDDPVLNESAPGQLGSSLRTAVDRLATSMASAEDFRRQLSHASSHDRLTNLSNRNAILSHLEAALARTRRASTSVSLLFVSLNGFKAVNEQYGHEVGDAVLRAIGRRLTAVVRSGDLPGRVGGDEFAVVAEPMASADDAVELAGRIIEALQPPVTYGGHTIHPRVSVGIAMSDDELTADELLRDADLAVFRAKSLGEAKVCVCDESLRTELQARVQVKHALAHAIEHDELFMMYQPIMNTDGSLASAESLVRWDRPGHGRVPPDSFIPVAERSDLIVDLDRWVLNAVVAQLACWSNHPELANVPVSVNISGRHFGASSVAGEVQDALERHGVAPERLTIEVTETAILSDLAGVGHELMRLRAMGVRVALDDFGTGYLSLSHLRSLPVDALKIDRSFVSGMDTDTDRTLVHLVAQTGQLLGLTVTAEGVETLDQVDQLVAIGADYLQGYHFSRPLDPDDLSAQAEQFTAGSALI